MPKPYAKIQRKIESPTLESEKRIREVLSLIKMGYQRNEIYDTLKEEYGVGPQQSWEYYHDALVLMSENEPLEEFANQVRMEQIERITNLYKVAREKNNMKAALAALDMLNKVHGLYNETRNLTVTADMIKFKFDE